MKKIIIFYASYGGGHLSAARSIKEYLQENYSNIEVELIDCIKYINKILNSVTTKAYSDMAKFAPNAWGKVYSKSQEGPLAKISIASNKVMSIKLNKLLQEKNPDLIISTHPFSSQMCAILKRKEKLNVPVATIMTDYAPHDQWLVDHEYINYFFVSHNGMKKALHEKGIPNSKIYTTGIPLSNKFLLKYNKKEILESFNLSPDKKTILFFGGGEFGLGKSKTFQLFESLISYNDNIQVVAISGKNEKMRENFDEIVRHYNKEDKVKVLPYTDKVPQLMSISDLVVTKPGGLTTTESLASGLPIIVINPIPGQEEENAEFLEKHGVAIWLKDNDDIEQKLSELFSDNEKMKEMKIKARLLAKKNSTRDICRILVS